MYLQEKIANKLPDAFVDAKKVIKSHITSCKCPIKNLFQHNKFSLMNLEHAKSMVDQWVPKIKNLRKNRVNNSIKDMDVPKEIQILIFGKNIKEDKINEDNNEISINYVMTEKRWKRTNVIVNNICAYNVALDFVYENEDSKPKSVVEYR